MCFSVKIDHFTKETMRKFFQICRDRVSESALKQLDLEMEQEDVQARRYLSCMLEKYKISIDRDSDCILCQHGTHMCGLCHAVDPDIIVPHTPASTAFATQVYKTQAIGPLDFEAVHDGGYLTGWVGVHVIRSMLMIMFQLVEDIGGSRVYDQLCSTGFPMPPPIPQPPLPPLPAPAEIPDMFDDFQFDHVPDMDLDEPDWAAMFGPHTPPHTVPVWAPLSPPHAPPSSPASSVMALDVSFSSGGTAPSSQESISNP
jgi:hypothetical protein